MTLTAGLRFPALAGALALTTGLLVQGCAEPRHLGYDYGRAYTESFLAQTDLTRPSVASAQYELGGVEASKIRLAVEQEATDAESVQITLGN